MSLHAFCLSSATKTLRLPRNMYELTAHPIQDRGYWDQLKTLPTVQRLLALIAGELPGIPDRLPLPTAADYLAARRDNDRSKLDVHWRQIRPMLSRLLVNRLTEGMADDDRLLNWLFDYTFEPCWVVSAHLPDCDLALSGRRQMDLAGCEMAGELAEARELLLPWITSQSQTLGQSIVNEIDRRCLTPLVNDTPEGWANPATRQINNWSGVCGGSLLTACLSLEAQGIPRPQARQKATEVVNLFLRRAFSPSGECEEGPMYWQYGVEYACLALSRMRPEEIESQFDAPRLRRVAGYLERAHICGNRFYAGNDSVSCLLATIGPMAWLAEFTGSSFLQWWVGSYPAAPARSINALVRDLFAAPTVAQWHTASPTSHPARFLEDQQVAIFQRPSSHGLFTFTLGGGTNAESHNHNDLGTFHVFLDDRPWIPDLGAPEYKQDFFNDAVRYSKYIVACSRGHCCPSINGYEQRPGQEAFAKVLAWSPEQGLLRLDLSSAYPAEAGLAQWVRQALVPPDQAQAVLQDTYQLHRDGQIAHRIWLRQQPGLNGSAITCGPLTIHMDEAPASIEVQAFAADDPRLLLRDFPASQTLYRVDCVYHARAAQTLSVRTRITLA